ncbi:MAG: prepilin-type N-terminal cleavage/methylation domain-containing protein [Kiritimatiellia bacterium]
MSTDKPREGMTLVEMMLALAILGAALAWLLASTSSCLAVIKKSIRYQEAQWTFGVGELEHVVGNLEEVEDMEVEPVEYDGYTFSREVGEDSDEDNLYVVRTRVSWGEGEGKYIEEVARYMYHREVK